ncbi:hypothetical protein M569_08103 [Genlisea aurea]|uniref:Bifunctional inhibitor/plant lipid transfer protein/seed storage helical domain-containing protein n=1 Tax=Genlisea aurea TaxID=192259 RepID=S8CIX3_9LAMI|nr:hypothetical protein M569_08103 [Genlisea aurea]
MRCASILLISLALIHLGANRMASAQCRGNLQDLIQQCGKFVSIEGPQQTPSPECCGVVKGVDVPCICSHVPPQAEEIISMPKAVFVVAACGSPLPHGATCGSYTVPAI